MDSQIYWEDQCMKKAQLVQSAKNVIQFTKVSAQRIKKSFQYHKIRLRYSYLSHMKYPIVWNPYVNLFIFLEL